MKNLLQKTIDSTLKSGADACDIILNSGESLNLSAQGGKLEKFKLSKSSVLGLRVIKDNKIGLSYSESFDQDAISYAIRSALDNAQFADINKFEKIMIKNDSDFIQKTTEFSDISTVDEKIEFALILESEVLKKDKRVQAVPYNNFSVSESKSYYMNSLGTYTEENDGFFSGYTSALVKEGELNSMHYSELLGRSFNSLNIENCIEESLEHAINWLHAKPIPTGKYDVIFTTSVFSQLIYSFSNYFSAKDAIDKKNPWEDKLGQSVASPQFNMIDVPQYKDAFSKYYVDSEGMFRKDLTLIENGILKSFYHNTATANYFNTNSTAHAARGVRSSLNVGSTNWLILPGKDSLSDVTEGTYLEIHDVMGLGRGDNVSGDFSFGISGYLCKNGIRIQPVKEVTVAGNFNKLLNNISRMGSDLKHNDSFSTFSPLIRFSELSIAGK